MSPIISFESYGGGGKDGMADRAQLDHSGIQARCDFWWIASISAAELLALWIQRERGKEYG